MRQTSGTQTKTPTLGELLKKVDVAMLTTVMEDGTLRCRPMARAQNEFTGTLWFVTDQDAPKVHEIETHPQVNVSYASPNDRCYLSISGKVDVVHDRKQAAELWDERFEKWLSAGPDNPKLALLKVTVEHAEHWDSGSNKMIEIPGFPTHEK